MKLMGLSLDPLTRDRGYWSARESADGLVHFHGRQQAMAAVFAVDGDVEAQQLALLVEFAAHAHHFLRVDTQEGGFVGTAQIEGHD